MPISKRWEVKPARSPSSNWNGEPSASTVFCMSCCDAQPSTPCSVRTLNQSVRRNSTSTLSSRGTTLNTG